MREDASIHSSHRLGVTRGEQGQPGVLQEFHSICGRKIADLSTNKPNSCRMGSVKSINNQLILREATLGAR